MSRITTQLLYRLSLLTSLIVLFVSVSAFTATISTPRRSQSQPLYLQHNCYFHGHSRRTHRRSVPMKGSTSSNNNNNNTGNTFMDRLPNEGEDVYFRRVVAIASSSQSFESAVLKEQPTPHDNTNSTTTTTTTTTTVSTTTTKKYVRAEVWEEQERQKSKSENWDERVQFDGQMHGNRVNQNDILRQHLKGF